MNKNIRQDYKLQRNRKIYEEYLSTDTSFNKLGKKYDLAPQRIQAIVKDMKVKGLGEKLEPKDAKEKRERFKNLATELREKDNVTEALEFFEQVVAWDEQNKNYRGMGDVYGHISICQHQLSEKTELVKEKLELLNQAEKTLRKALGLSKNHKLPEGAPKITSVHLASNRLRTAELLKNTKKTTELKKALRYINSALKDFPGSESHKTWPLNIKAKIQHRMGNTKEAIKTLQEAEQKIYDGYLDETVWPSKRKDGLTNVIGDDQAKLKLSIWAAMINLTYAYIYKETKRYILAQFKAAAVLSMENQDNMLDQQKRKAKEILSEL